MTNLMPRRMTSVQKNWVRWTSWLLMVASLVITPVASQAAPSQPAQVTPSGYLPYLNNNDCSGQRSQEIPIGTQLYGATGTGTDHFSLLQNTFSPWLRNSIYWLSAEPANVPPAQFRWGQADGVFNAVKQNCVNMIVTIEGTPSWAQFNGNDDGRSPFKAENLPDFVEFITALVERYDGDGIADAPSGIKIDYWEFYNEPDFGSEISAHEGWGNYPVRYAEMLEAIYEPVHEANPDAKILLGGLAYNLFVGEGNGGLFVRSFFDGVLDAGGGEFFDMMNFHYYPFQHNRTVWTTNDSSGLIEKYAALKAILDEHDVDKPFMITEVGWHSSTTNAEYPSTPAYQANRVLELMTQGISLGSEATIWWTFFDERQDFAYRTGLTTADTPPAAKPSYEVYQELVQRLGNSEFIETTLRPTDQNDLEAHRFRDKNTNKTFYVTWLTPVAPVNNVAVPTFNDGETQNLQFPGEKGTVISKEGNVVQVVNDSDDGNDDGKVTIAVGRSPLYVVIN